MARSPGSAGRNTPSWAPRRPRARLVEWLALCVCVFVSLVRYLSGSQTENRCSHCFHKSLQDNLAVQRELPWSLLVTLADLPSFTVSDRTRQFLIGHPGTGLWDQGVYPHSVIQGNLPLWVSLWEALFVVSQKWIPFPTAIQA